MSQEEGRKKKNPHLASTKKNSPICLKFGGCLVGVLRVSGGCLEGVWRVSGVCVEGV